MLICQGTRRGAVALWMHWWSVTWQLRPACARLRSFLWFATCVAGMTVRTDLLGVTSTIRALGLQQQCYDRLLDAFHSSAIKLPAMTSLWAQVVLRCFPGLLWVNGRLVFVGDGIKVAKRGRKMPAVKLLHFWCLLIALPSALTPRVQTIFPFLTMRLPTNEARNMGVGKLDSIG